MPAAISLIVTLLIRQIDADTFFMLMLMPLISTFAVDTPLICIFLLSPCRLHAIFFDYAHYATPSMPILRYFFFSLRLPPFFAIVYAATPVCHIFAAIIFIAITITPSRCRMPRACGARERTLLLDSGAARASFALIITTPRSARVARGAPLPRDMPPRDTMFFRHHVMPHGAMPTALFDARLRDDASARALRRAVISADDAGHAAAAKTVTRSYA